MGPPAAQLALEKKLKFQQKPVGTKPLGGKQEIQTNFNLSFNNSFNTSYNNANDSSATHPHQILAFSSSPANTSQPQTGILSKIRSNSVGPSAPADSQQEVQYQGFFTADAIYLEKLLTNRLKEASDNEDRKMQAFNQTFNEIIKRDKNFGSLLLKIKHAYDEYIRRSAQSQQASPTIERSTYEELAQKVKINEQELINQRVKNEELQRIILQMKEEADERQR